jgi:hypothetical protein
MIVSAKIADGNPFDQFLQTGLSLPDRLAIDKVEVKRVVGVSCGWIDKHDSRIAGPGAVTLMDAVILGQCRV